MHQTSKQLFLGVLLACASGACSKDQPVRGQSEASEQTTAQSEQDNQPYSASGGTYQDQPSPSSMDTTAEREVESTDMGSPSTADSPARTEPSTTGMTTPGTGRSAGPTSATATPAPSTATPATGTSTSSTPTASTTGTSATGTGSTATAPAGTTAAAAPARDNTKVNERDRGGSTLTPMDQGTSKKDREITQRIREAVVADDGLSFTAKNVKIITVDGRVTLRGPVRNGKERLAIEAAARNVAGEGQVDNQLEVSN